MKRARVLVPAITLLPLLTLGCGSSGGSGSESVTCNTNGMIIANDMNGYSFQSSLMLHPVKVKPKSDLMVDWSMITKDFQGHAVNAKTDLQAIFLLSVQLPSTTLEMQLNDDTFSTNSIIIPGVPPVYTPMNGTTSTSLISNFQSAQGPVMQSDLDTYLDASTYTPANSTFAFVAQTGATPGALGSQIRMLQSFELDSTSNNTMITMTNSSTTLTYSANLHSLHPTGVPAGTANLTLDWSQLMHNGLGTAMTDDLRRNIDHAIVGHYTQTPSQIEGQFLDIQTIADHLYEADIESGFVLDFSTLQDSSGNAFPGIDGSGTWLVALQCTTNCRNPAPYYLTILEPNPSTCK